MIYLNESRSVDQAVARYEDVDHKTIEVDQININYINEVNGDEKLQMEILDND